MSAFNTKEELVLVLSALWDDIFNTPAITEIISAENLIVKFRFTDFGTDLYVDNKGEVPRYYWDPPDDVAFDVEMIQTSDTSHLFWMQKLNVPMAIATRKVVAKGSVQKALKLIPALKPAFALYPEILKRMGKADLLQEAPKKKRKRRFKIFPRRRSGTYKLDALPLFPLQYGDGTIKGEMQERSAVAKTVSEADLSYVSTAATAS